ncbi:sensor histidine kinase [Leisingera sp.]|uniref:sensor histidine kinase n=1 Tax=Leisingera sp. TaxID=1879318 RepID=UPI003A922601
MESGELRFREAPFDLVALVEDVTALLAPTASEKNLRICNEFEVPFPAWFSGDSGRIRQCLINLVGNAVKFTDSGRVLVSVRSDGLVGINITVKDTGPGIPEAVRDRIFLAFEQVETGANRSTDGTGLGLAITRQLAELMGGEVRVSDEPGYGAVFTLKLPLSPVPVPSQNAEPNCSRLRRTPLRRIQSKR